MLSHFLLLLMQALNNQPILPVMASNWEIVDQTEQQFTILCPQGHHIKMDRPNPPYRSLPALEFAIFSQCSKQFSTPDIKTFSGQLQRQSQNAQTLPQQVRRIARAHARQVCQQNNMVRLNYNGRVISCRRVGQFEQCRARWIATCQSKP